MYRRTRKRVAEKQKRRKRGRSVAQGQKKRGRKVEGEVWAVDLTAMDAEGRWLRYRDLKKILGDTMDWVSQVRKDEWMVKACYSIFSLHKQGDRQIGRASCRERV